MSTDSTDPEGATSGATALSRRGLLTAAGAVGVAATAATVIGVPASSSATAQPAPDQPGSGSDAGTDAGTESAADGAIVIHVRDVAAGTLDIYKGTGYRRLRDPDLAARLAAAARS